MSESHHYWDRFAAEYQQVTNISCNDFHYGPLIPGDSELQLLPPVHSGMRCLELACGGAQNSVYLAKQGAICTAVDISQTQLQAAAVNAEAHNVDMQLKQLKLEDITPALGQFELTHSAYGLNFTSNIEAAISTCEKMLSPEGTLLFSLPHPLFAAEFLELDDDEGLFVTNYYNIPPEERHSKNGKIIEQSFFYNISELSSILAAANFTIEKIAEPQPSTNPPYTSQVWEEYRDQFRKFPSTLIIKAVRKK
ncbi:MAG: methyltransferase domain-containing protein [Lentisphaerae bacterium]|nr:methyltransferase domain-containing protein [Lentisphaerota bacterium]MCP4100389.1 methyltransferase domain-containing protein [Lentisphaerota bacterium]